MNTKNETTNLENENVNTEQVETPTEENKSFNTMDYIDLRKTDMFASVTLKADTPSDFGYEDSIAITLRMLYENQKKILSNQKNIWVAINSFSPDELLKPDIQRAMRRIADGIFTAASDLYR